jgi:hypothetical protein
VLDGSMQPEEWMKGVTPQRTVFATGRTLVGGIAPPQPNPWRAFDGAFSFAQARGSVSGGGVVSAPALGRIVEGMPQSVEFSFDVRVQKQPVVFSAQVFFEPEVPGCMLQVHSQGLYLHDMAPRRRAGGFPQQVQFDGKIKNEATHRRIRLLADRPSGKLIVVIDGVVIGQIARKPGDGLRNFGRGFSLMPQASAPCTFSNLWVGPWDGRVPGRSGAAPEAADAPHSLLLVNGDEALGVVESATPEAVKLQSEIGTIEVPAERLSMVQFTDAPVEPRPAARLRLRAGGALTLHSYRVEGDAVHCQSEVAGDLAVPRAAVSEIVFDQRGRGSRTK